MTATFDSGRKSSKFILSGGDLTATGDGSAGPQSVASTVENSTGKFYCEFTITARGSVGCEVGIANSTASFADGADFAADSVNGYAYWSGANKIHFTSFPAYGATFTSGDIISMLFDATAGELSFWKNGADQGVAFTGIAGAWAPAIEGQTNAAPYTTITANFGATAFTYTRPAGYEGWSPVPPTPGNAEGTLQAITGYGARLAAGAGTLQPIGGSGGYNGRGAGTMAPFEISATGGHNGGAGTLPAITALATGRQAHYGVGTLAAITASGTGTDSSIITIARSAPAPTLSATLISGSVITVTANAPAPILTATLDSGRIITVAISAPAPTLSARILTGNVATILASAATPILSAAGYPAYTITFAGVAPAPYLSATLSAVVASAYRTFVLNTRRGALTEYDGFSFNSYCVFNGVVLAAGASGVVALGTQALDNATAIAATVTSGQDNFGTSKIKRVPRIYIDYTTDGDAQFSLTTTEGGARTYSLAWNSVTGVQQRRIGVGKGPKSFRWQWSYTNVSGADFSLGSVLAYPTVTRRRVQ